MLGGKRAAPAAAAPAALPATVAASAEEPLLGSAYVKNAPLVPKDCVPTERAWKLWKGDY